MNLTRTLTALLAMGGLMASIACTGGAAATPAAPAATAAAPAPAPNPTSPAPPSADTPPAGLTPITVNTRNDPKLGPILVNGAGRTLYKFDRDSKGTSACSGGCLATWPPLLQPSGQPTGGASVAGGALSAFNRSDNGRQVAYKDAPLYTYAADTAPGDTKGDGVGGAWHVVAP